MTYGGQHRLSAVMRALSACAGGITFQLKTHHYWATYQGNVFQGLPKGPGYGNMNSQIEFRHVALLCRALGIDLACVKGQLGVRG